MTPFFLLIPITKAAETTTVSLGLSQQIANFYQWALGIGGLVALGIIVFGGILYTVSAGNASKQDDAKQWITGALIGLLLLFGSYLILNTINPELTKLNDLKLIVNEAAQKNEVDNFKIVEDVIGFKKQLFELLRQTDSVNAMSWLWIAGCESAWTYNPAIENHSSNVPDPAGACGLFQTSCACRASDPHDCGKGDVATQVQNAIALFHERGPGYWDAADGSCGDGYNGRSILSR